MNDEHHTVVGVQIFNSSPGTANTIINKRINNLALIEKKQKNIYKSMTL